MSFSIIQKRSLKGHTGSVYSLEPLALDNFLSGGVDGIVAKWNTTDGEAGEAIFKSKEPVYSLKYISALNILLVGQSKGGVHFVNLSTGKEEKLLQLHTAAVFVINYTCKHRLIITGGGDGIVQILNHEFQLIYSLTLSTAKIRSIIFSADEERCIIGSGDGMIAVIMLNNFSIIHQWQAHQPGFGVNTLCLSQDDTILLSGSRDAHLNIYNAVSFELLQSIPAHNYAIYDISFHPSGDFFATASRDKSVKIWDARNFQLLVKIDKESFDGHINSVNKLLWLNDDLVSTGDDRSILIWTAMF